MLLRQPWRCRADRVGEAPVPGLDKDRTAPASAPLVRALVAFSVGAQLGRPRRSICWGLSGDGPGVHRRAWQPLPTAIVRLFQRYNPWPSKAVSRIRAFVTRKTQFSSSQL
jgi:hypothetical protein